MLPNLWQDLWCESKYYMRGSFRGEGFTYQPLSFSVRGVPQQNIVHLPGNLKIIVPSLACTMDTSDVFLTTLLYNRDYIVLDVKYSSEKEGMYQKEWPHDSKLDLSATSPIQITHNSLVGPVSLGSGEIERSLIFASNKVVWAITVGNNNCVLRKGIMYVQNIIQNLSSSQV